MGNPPRQIFTVAPLSLSGRAFPSTVNADRAVH